MQYHLYRQRHIPLGSGVTEAACKTVFTQRLKLSGQRWSREGAKNDFELASRLVEQNLADHFSGLPKIYQPRQNETLPF